MPPGYFDEDEEKSDLLESTVIYNGNCTLAPIPLEVEAEAVVVPFFQALATDESTIEVEKVNDDPLPFICEENSKTASLFVLPVYYEVNSIPNFCVPELETCCEESCLNFKYPELDWNRVSTVLNGIGLRLFLYDYNSMSSSNSCCIERPEVSHIVTIELCLVGKGFSVNESSSTNPGFELLGQVPSFPPIHSSIKTLCEVKHDCSLGFAHYKFRMSNVNATWVSILIGLSYDDMLCVNCIVKISCVVWDETLSCALYELEIGCVLWKEIEFRLLLYDVCEKNMSKMLCVVIKHRFPELCETDEFGFEMQRTSLTLLDRIVKFLLFDDRLMQLNRTVCFDLVFLLRVMKLRCVIWNEFELNLLLYEACGNFTTELRLWLDWHVSSVLSVTIGTCKFVLECPMLPVERYKGCGVFFRDHPCPAQLYASLPIVFNCLFPVNPPSKSLIENSDPLAELNCEILRPFHLLDVSKSAVCVWGMEIGLCLLLCNAHPACVVEFNSVVEMLAASGISK